MKMEVGPPKRTAFRGAASDNWVCRSVLSSQFLSKEKRTIGILLLCPSLLFVLRSCLFSHSSLALFFFFLPLFFLVLVFRFLIIFQYSFYLPACIFKPFLPTFLLICIFTDTFIFFFSSFKSQETTILSFSIIDWSAIVSYVLKTNISRLSLLFFYLVPYSIDQRFEPHAASLQL